LKKKKRTKALKLIVRKARHQIINTFCKTVLSVSDIAFQASTAFAAVWLSLTRCENITAIARISVMSVLGENVFDFCRWLRHGFDYGTVIGSWRIVL
jgi:hypothetical protein